MKAGILALLVCAAADLFAQARAVAAGGAGSSTARVASPAVVASWMSHESAADGSTTTLLVLWRGTPGWFSKGGRGGSAGWTSGGGSTGRGSHVYQSFSEGGLSFTLEFDHERHTATLLKQEFSLKDTNVVLVDFVDGPGPAIAGSRWIEPGPPASPAVPGAAPDPVAGVIRRSPELFDYLRCDLSLPDPRMNAMLSMVCGLMRPPASR